MKESKEKDRAGPILLRAALWLGLAAAFFLLWQLRAVLLLILGAILGAILLNLLASGVCRVTRLSKNLGLLVATTIVIGLIGLSIGLFGNSLSAQFGDIMNRVQEAQRQLYAMLGGSHIGKAVVQHGTSAVGNALSGFVSIGLNFIEIAIIVAVMAIYLAAEPQMYRRGAAKLFPADMAPKALKTLDLVGASLRLWLLGQLILMVLVGVLTYIAVLILGLPNPGALALIAGLTEIVPYLGPFIGAVPAVLVALTQGMSLALWTVALYLGIHLVEGYAVGPLLQRWFVRIPPALILASIFAAQLLFGFAGIVLAAPLAVVCFAAVKVFYVRGTLGRRAEMPTHMPL